MPDVPPKSFLTRLLSDLGYYVPAQILSNIFNVSAIAIFTRLLDREQYGEYTLVFSGATLVCEFGFGWIHASSFRYWYKATSDGETSEQRFLTAIALMTSALALVVAIAWPLVAHWLFPGVSTQASMIGYAVLATTVAQRFAMNRTRVTRQVRVFFVYSIAPQLVNITLGSALIVFGGMGGDGLLLSVAAGGGVIGISELLRNARGYLPRRLELDRPELRRHIDYGLPILVATFASTLMLSSDRFFIAHFFDEATAGVYILAYNLTFKIDQLSRIVLSAAFPILVQDYDTKPKEEVGAGLTRLLSLMTTLMVPAGVGLALVADPLTDVLLGERFYDAREYIGPLVPGVIAVGLTAYFSKPLQLAAKTAPQLIIQAIAVVPQVVLLVILLPRYGPIVAAYTTSLGLGLYAIGTYVWSRRYLPYSLPIRESIKIALSTSIMAGLAWLASLPLHSALPVLFVRVTVGTLVYSGLVWAFDIGSGRELLTKAIGKIARRRAA